ncbi:MAG: helix-turn-helix domain-containing protein [Armatimonadota bacterium]
MIDFRILHVGVYGNPERNRQFIECATISFNISGLIHMSQNGYALDASAPSLKIGPPGSLVVFEYGKNRENWVILIDTPHIRSSERPGFIQVFYRNQWIEYPLVIPIEPERVAGLRMEFKRIMESVQSPFPKNQLLADLGVMNLIRTVLNHNTGILSQSPAALLKKLIDADNCYHVSLSELSRQCGLSVDHMRTLFRKEFNMSPVQYRNNRRMAMAMEYIANSRLSVSEIAGKLGYAHVSHFSAVFHTCFEVSPTQAIQRFRHGVTA